VFQSTTHKVKSNVTLRVVDVRSTSDSRFSPSTAFATIRIMPAPTPSPNNNLPATSQSGTEPRTQVPLRTTWPRLKKKVKREVLRDEMKKRFGYYPHDWQMQAALKVLEGSDGIVVAGTGKGKTIIFALLGLAAELSESMGHYIIVSPLKALEGDQVCTKVLRHRLRFIAELHCRLNAWRKQASDLWLSTRTLRGRRLLKPYSRWKSTSYSLLPSISFTTRK
jgi:hypothetical protein